MTIITPGIDLLVPNILKLSVPPILLVTLTTSYIKPTVPTWLVVSASIISIPLVPILAIIWKSISDGRAAAAIGARPIPMVIGKLLGNFDILTEIKRLAGTAYPGT
jgi:hypothetical protein